MRIPSKRTAAIAAIESERKRAFHANDHEGFKAAVEQIAALEETDDVYTCPQCGKDFPNGPHIDILAAAILTCDDQGVVSASADYGLLATEQRENGRRIKICKPCHSTWAIPIMEYVEMR